jgi:hypothetical protein
MMDYELVPLVKVEGCYAMVQLLAHCEEHVKSYTSSVPHNVPMTHDNTPKKSKRRKDSIKNEPGEDQGDIDVENENEDFVDDEESTNSKNKDPSMLQLSGVAARVTSLNERIRALLLRWYQSPYLEDTYLRKESEKGLLKLGVHFASIQKTNHNAEEIKKMQEKEEAEVVGRVRELGSRRHVLRELMASAATGAVSNGNLYGLDVSRPLPYDFPVPEAPNLDFPPQHSK